MNQPGQDGPSASVPAHESRHLNNGQSAGGQAHIGEIASVQGIGFAQHRPHLVNSPSTPEETLLEFVVTATQPAHSQGGPRDLVGVAANPLDGVDDAGHDDAREGELGKDLPADRGLADSRRPAEPSHGDEIVVHRLAIRGRGDRLLVLHPGEGQQRRVAAPRGALGQRRVRRAAA